MLVVAVCLCFADCYVFVVDLWFRFAGLVEFSGVCLIVLVTMWAFLCLFDYVVLCDGVGLLLVCGLFALMLGVFWLFLVGRCCIAGDYGSLVVVVLVICVDRVDCLLLVILCALVLRFSVYACVALAAGFGGCFV